MEGQMMPVLLVNDVAMNNIFSDRVKMNIASLIFW